MEDSKEKKSEIRDDITAKLDLLSENEISVKNLSIEEKLFDFANFLESNISLFYMNSYGGFNIRELIKKCLAQNSIIVLPSFDVEKHEMELMKIDNVNTDLKIGQREISEPDPARCKSVPIDSIDIAFIPGIAFDEKGGRIGSGEGYYDRFIPNLPVTTRKVAFAFDCQIVPQIPMESHDKHVDIIITDKRIIYKI